MSGTRPTVLLKLAASLDGFIGGVGQERVIFSDAADRAVVLGLRRRADAILIGGTTLRRDDPRLLTSDADDVAAASEHGASRTPEPLRVVLTTNGEIPRAARLFAAGPKVLVCCPRERVESLGPALGAAVSLFGYGAIDQSIPEVLDELARRGVSRLLVEGGSEIAAAFLAARAVDVVRIAFAPLFLGTQGGASLSMQSVRFPGLDSPLQLCVAEQIGRMLVGWFELPWAKTRAYQEWTVSLS